MSELPDSWASVTLATIGDWKGGGTPSKSNPSFWENGTIPWVSPKDMKQAKLHGAFDKITEAAVKASATNLISGESVLMVTRSGILSHSLPVAVNTVPVALNQDIKAVTPSGATSAMFLWYAFNCFKRDILNSCRKGGTTVHSIEFPALQAFIIPLAPLKEQKRIVAKIEELFSEMDAGEESLRKARRQLGVYRQSLLKQAFEGKLTAAWREQNRPLLESPEQLLNTIQSAREGNYEKLLIEWKAGLKQWEAGGEKRTRPAKPRRPEAVTMLADHSLSKLPEAWIRLRFECFGDWCGGGTPSKANKSFWANGTIPWVSPKDMKSRIILSTLDRITDQAVINSTAKLVSKPSVLFVIRSGILRRVLPVAMTNQPVTLNQDMQAFTPVHATTDFIYWYCQSVERDIRDLCAKDGTTVESVDVTSLKRYPSPLCSLAEQQEIVRLLDEQFTVIEQNEREIDTALKRSEVLRQSILKKAFSGHLVAQDPADEPASALLERIRAEREAPKEPPRKLSRTPRAKPAPEIKEDSVPAIAPVEARKAKPASTPGKTDLQAGLVALAIAAHENGPEHLGHVKAEKIVHLCDVIARLQLDRHPVKDAAGPNDSPQAKKVEHRAKMQGWFTVTKKPGAKAYSYQRGRNFDRLVHATEVRLGPQLQTLRDLISDLATMSVKDAELVATVHAAWNNLILAGKSQPKEEAIVKEARENWHPDKLKIQREKFFDAIAWIESSDLLPTGKGSPVEVAASKSRPPNSFQSLA